MWHDEKSVSYQVHPIYRGLGVQDPYVGQRVVREIQVNCMNAAYGKSPLFL